MRSFVYGVYLRRVDVGRCIFLFGYFVFHGHFAAECGVVIVVDNLGVGREPEVALGFAGFFRVGEGDWSQARVFGIYGIYLLLGERIVDVNLTKSRQVCAVGGEIIHHLLAEVGLEIGGVVHVEFLLVPIGGRVPVNGAESARSGERGVEVKFGAHFLRHAVRIASEHVITAHGVVLIDGHGVGGRRDELLSCSSGFGAGNHAPHFAVVDLRHVAGGVVFSQESGFFTSLAYSAREFPRGCRQHLTKLHLVGKRVVHVARSG